MSHEEVVASFEALSRYLPTRAEDMYEKFPGGLLA